MSGSAGGSKGLTALLLGGTGEVGKEVLKQLITNPAFSHVYVVGRRKVDDITSDKVEHRVIDFDNLDQHSQAFEGAEVAFCCLGTTRGKAGKEGFIKVDRDYVVNASKLLRAAGCNHMHLVTSSGANKDSMMLYQKTKGEAEELVKEMQFPRLSIYRPGLLLCDRTESRLLESFAQALAKGFDWRNRMSIYTETVARAMITNTLCPPSTTGEEVGPPPLVEVLNNMDILRLGID